MEESQKKRTGKETGTVQKKTLLVHLVGNRIDIIEKKENDFQANLAKIRAWEEIFGEFRARYGERRSIKEIRDQWKRIKLAGKAEWTDFSKKRRMTGEPPQQPSDLSVHLRDMVPNEFAQILNEYDDDAGIARQNDDAVYAFEYLAGMLPVLEKGERTKYTKKRNSRRNFVRVFGIPEKKGEDTDQLLIKAVSDHLPCPISSANIDHSHRSGRPRADSKKPRPILVKLTHYRKKAALMKDRRQLKGSGISIQEDLTKANHHILLKLSNHPKVEAAWTVDGSIMAALKMNEEGISIKRGVTSLQEVSTL
ncbi:uncharacterized protein LOC135156439 [Lytechinus pictus]|uniref:uncharacterized protein LOC135156439 n=1 Tax=Lytechinus pictus TaxID=7653 RepID=UPI0030B9B790